MWLLLNLTDQSKVTQAHTPVIIKASRATRHLPSSFPRFINCFVPRSASSKSQPISRSKLIFDFPQCTLRVGVSSQEPEQKCHDNFSNDM